MNLYLLTPINEHEPDWLLSGVRCAVQVWATDEPQARHTASDQLCPSHLLNPKLVLARPWSRVDRAVASRPEKVDDALPLLEGTFLSGRPNQRSRQQLYLLMPIDLKNRQWELSLGKSPVCVWARNSSHARALAALHFDINAARVPDQEPLLHPWWNPKLVTVEQVDNPLADVKTITPKDLPARFGSSMHRN